MTDYTLTDDDIQFTAEQIVALQNGGKPFNVETVAQEIAASLICCSLKHEKADPWEAVKRLLAASPRLCELEDKAKGPALLDQDEIEELNAIRELNAEVCRRATS